MTYTNEQLLDMIRDQFVIEGEVEDGVYDLEIPGDECDCEYLMVEVEDGIAIEVD